jgi:Concanavalin A-like lectin/glucanases superfamily
MPILRRLLPPLAALLTLAAPAVSAAHDKPPQAPGQGAPYRAAVLGDQPRAYWRLDEQPGAIVAEDERHGLPGAYRGSPLLGLLHPLGKEADNTSADLDGLVMRPLGDWIQVSDGDDVAFPGREPFTLEAWVHPHNLNTVTRRVFSKEGPDGGWLLGVRNDGLVFSRYAHGQWSTLRTSVDATRWTYVVATYDGAVMSVYIDGWLSAQGPSELELPAEREDLSIGAKQGRWRYFAGGLDELAIYDRALSNGRALAHYRLGGGTP